MCANYIPVTQSDSLLKYFEVERGEGELPPEVYPGFVAPFIRVVDGNRRAVEAGLFGMLPPWRRELQYARQTYNSRSETVAQLPSFRDAWRKGTRCVIPVWAVYEPRHNQDHTKERWRIERADGTPFGIAGIYNEWMENGKPAFSYTMLTVNADRHPFYQQFHAPDDEKRMPVFLDPEEYDAWMTCPLADAAKFFRAWPGDFVGKPEPRAVRAVKTPAVKPAPGSKPIKAAAPPPPPPPPPPPQGSLF